MISLVIFTLQVFAFPRDDLSTGDQGSHSMLESYRQPFLSHPVSLGIPMMVLEAWGFTRKLPLNWMLLWREHSSGTNAFGDTGLPGITNFKRGGKAGKIH